MRRSRASTPAAWNSSSDSKAKYSSGAATQRALAQLDAELKRKLNRAAERTAEYHKNWQAANLNDIVDRFAKGSSPVVSGSKIIFQAKGSPLQVVCDVRGGYCRLKDTRIKSGRRQYLGINGHNASNKVTATGKQAGRSQPEYNEVTHFRILKREEM